jgi:hypothetical protein
LWSIAGEVEELHRQRHSALAVGDGVMQLLDQCAAATLETLDDDELPQRSRAIEGVVGDQRGEILQLAHRTGIGKRHASDVVTNVELRVAHPARRTACHWRRLHALAQSRDRDARAVHARDEGLEVDRAIEDGDIGERGSEERVLLDSPHQRLGIGHALVEAWHLVFHQPVLCVA